MFSFGSPIALDHDHQQQRKNTHSSTNRNHSKKYEYNDVCVCTCTSRKSKTSVHVCMIRASLFFSKINLEPVLLDYLLQEAPTAGLLWSQGSS